MSNLYILDEGDTKSHGKNSTHAVVWQSSGFANNAAIRTAILAHASYASSVSTADGYTLDNINWHYGRQAKSHRKVTLTYSHQESKRNKNQNPVLQNVGDEETQISYSFIEVPITEAITQTKFGDSPDIGRRIKYNPQTRHVEGTTRKTLVSRIRVTKIYAAATVTEAWIKTREDKLFTLNNATFRSRPTETLMFTGMEMTQRSQSGDWHVTFFFQYQRTETKDLAHLDINDTGSQTIYPYRFYHALYEEEEDTSAKVLVPKAKGFYEAEIYETSDFSTNLI